MAQKAKKTKKNQNPYDIQLGDTARDTITGFEGVVVCKSEWLNGCIRLMLQGKKLKDNVPTDPLVFDIDQLELVESAKRKEPEERTGGPRPDAGRAKQPKRSWER